MSKKVRVAILFDMLLNAGFKMATSLVNIATTTARASKFMC